jgi:acetyl-CoA acetyltransferase
MGCANQAGEDNRNVARMSLLLAGLPQTVPGETVNRLCSSGLSAIINASRAIKAGDGHVFIAGGIENMTRGPLVVSKPSCSLRNRLVKCTIPVSDGVSSIRKCMKCTVRMRWVKLQKI